MSCASQALFGAFDHSFDLIKLVCTLIFDFLVLAKLLDNVSFSKISAHSLIKHVYRPERDFFEDLRIPLDLSKALLLVYLVQTFIQLHEVIMQTKEYSVTLSYLIVELYDLLLDLISIMDLLPIFFYQCWESLCHLANLSIDLSFVLEKGQLVLESLLQLSDGL